MDENPVAISVQNLTKKYSSRADSPESLKDLSFEIPLGKVCVLLGPNGSGKTTLLKILAGLLRPTSGSFAITGFDGMKEPRKARSKIGWMPADERSGFYGRLTGRQNLAFFAALHGVTGKSFDRIVGNLGVQIGLREELDVPLQRISTGTKQKIALARALIHNPPVLLLDEPTRNLDPHAVIRFRRLLRDHLTRREKKTILLSTHQLEEAKKIADVIVIIAKGRLMSFLQGREIEGALAGTTAEQFYLKTVDSGDTEDMAEVQAS